MTTGSLRRGSAWRRTATAPGRSRRGRRRRLLSAVTVIVGVLVTGACGDEDHVEAPPTSAAPSTTGPVPGTPTASATGGDATPSPSHSALPLRCTRDHLDLSLGRVSPGAGNRYAPLVFTNTGPDSCSLRGYPGVTLLDSSGDRIGEPAEPQGPEAPAVTLRPGGSAYAGLHTVAEGVTDKPCRRPADKVQAYPPGSTWALRAPARSFQVCGEVFEVGAVRPGEHP
ncbi:DUF4232 domain-containing protein [Streptomyces sp. NPDC002845]